MVCVNFSDLTLPKKAQNPWGHPQASRMFPPAADGTVQKEDLKLQMGGGGGGGGGRGGTATLHIPKILSFGEVKISA